MWPISIGRSTSTARSSGFTLLSQKEQLAAVNAPGSDRAQVLVLRALGRSPMGGARHVGLRAFVLEVDSAEQLERIAD